MSTIKVTDTQGASKQITLTTGITLMELLRDAGYDEIMAMCGGCCSCATCHVHIEDKREQLPPIEEDEEMLLSMADNYDTQQSRLSCQIPLTEEHADLHVVLVETE